MKIKSEAVILYSQIENNNLSPLKNIGNNTMDSVQFVEISFGSSKRNQSRVLLSQPSWSKNDFDKENDMLCFAFPEKVKPWIDRFLLKAEEHQCSLILFPELSIPEMYIEHI